MRKESNEQREHRLQTQREYNEKNRLRIRKLIAENQKSDKYLERIRTSFYICDCGSQVLSGGKNKHLMSLKHNKWLNK